MTTKNQLTLALFLIGQCALFANSNPTNSSLVRDCIAFPSTSPIDTPAGARLHNVHRSNAQMNRVPTNAANFAVTVFGGCNSGISPGEVLICENGPLCLFELLEGDPTPDGAWIGPIGWVDLGFSGCGQFDPTSDPPGDYTYAVFGQDGEYCTTTITMVYNDLGSLADYAHCGPDTLDLNSLLITTGLPPDGTWYYPNGTQVPFGMLDPNEENADPGTYTFEFYDANTCFTIVQVGIIFSTGSSGGIETWVDICSTTEFITPFDLLEGNPSPGGQFLLWGPNGNFLDYYTTYDVIVSLSDFESGSYFTYTLGASPCDPTAVGLHINIINTPNAGIATTASICHNSPPIDLPILLDGNPDPGLNWTLLDVDPPGEPSTISNPFDPSLYPPNTTLQLLYSWEDPTGQCASSALLTLHILPGDAYAGEDNTVSLCENAPQAPFDMFNELLGTIPQVGGAWTDPFGNLSSSFFSPGSSPLGIYTYTVASSCGFDSATLTIYESEALTSDNDSTLSLCLSYGEVMLDSLINGNADLSGHWTNPAGEYSIGIINTETALSGTYTYTVEDGPCAGSANVTLSFELPSNAAGPDVILPTYCGSGEILYLENLLDPSAEINGSFVPSDSVILNPQNSGTYYYVVPNDGVCPNDVAYYNIEINDEISVSSIIENCSPSGLEYTVSFDITGGASSYTVFDASGGIVTVLQSMTYTSGTMSMQAFPSYSFIISDNGACPDVVLSGESPECQCETAYSTFSIANSAICAGECTNISFDLEGTGPFDLQYSDGTNDINLTGVNDGHIITVCPEQPTTYTLLSVSNSICNEPILDQTVSIDVAGLGAAGPDTTLTICESIWWIPLADFLHPEASSEGEFNPIYLSPENQMEQEVQYIVESELCDADTALYSFSFHDLPEYSLLQANCNLDDPSTYTVTFDATTGLPPYTSDFGNFDENTFTSDIMSLADSALYHIVFTDANGCSNEIWDAISDSDGDGICDEGEIVGCQNPDAPNYNPLATDPGPCQAGGFEDAPDVLSDVSTDEPGGGWGLVSQTGNDANHWDFSLFPNPWQSAAKLQIALRGLTDEKPVQLELHDLTGRLVWKQSMALQNGIEIYAITLPSDLDMGTYLFSVLSQDGERKSKVLLINK